MSLVTDVASTELGKQAVAIRTDEQAAAARATVEKLTRRTLTADAAVQIALLNNRGLQAAYNELAKAEAERVSESLPPNPRLTLSRVSGSLETEIEKQVVADILALATLPVRADIARTRFEQAQLRAAQETLRTAAEARRAYYRAVATRELADFLSQAQITAQSAAAFSKRLGETGAMNKLDQAREQVFYAEVTTQLASARQRASSEREGLVRALGLWGSDLAFKLPNSLPALPRSLRSRPFVESEAVRRRIDLQIARLELASLAKTYGLRQATRFVNLLEGGYKGKTTRDKQSGEVIRDHGFDIEVQIPIFDFGESRVREAEATYMQALNRLIEKAVNVRSEARDAYRVHRSAYEIARHYESEILPLRKIISDETLLRYNSMQIDVFSLLTEARQRINSTVAAIEAKRDYWLGSTDLNVAIIGGGGASGAATASPSIASAAPSSSDGH